MAESISQAALNLSATDVYELAADISQECERIGEQFGQDVVSSLVPRVLKILELLEESVERTEILTADLVEAQLEREKAQDDRRKEVEYRQKIEEEYGTALNQQGVEVAKLKGRIRELVEENQSLQTASKKVQRQQSTGLTASYNEMSEQIEKQREELRSSKLEIARQTTEIDALFQQARRITAINQALQRSQALAQSKSKKLAEEKVALAAKIVELERIAEQGRPASEEATTDGGGGGAASSSEAQDSVDRGKQLRYTREDMQYILDERLKYKLRVDELEEEMALLRESLDLSPDMESSMSVQRPAPRRRNSKLRNLFNQMDAATDPTSVKTGDIDF